MELLFALLLGRALASEEPQLALECEVGRAESCLARARALTGVGAPVDLLGAKKAYERACTLGQAEGCRGAEGLARVLGRQVELFLLSSTARVWVLVGPLRVTSGRGSSPATAEEAAAVQARLPFAEACYATGLQDAPALEGLIDLSLQLRGGQVVEILVHQSALADEETARCIAAELGKARMPPGTKDGELYLRLRAEPAPAARLQPPVIGGRLADGLQMSVGDPDEGLQRRVAIAFTAAVRRALDGSACLHAEAAAGRLSPAELRVEAQLAPGGEARALRVSGPAGREGLADCLGQSLQGLQIGQTGLSAEVPGTLRITVQPTWTAALVP